MEKNLKMKILSTKQLPGTIYNQLEELGYKIEVHSNDLPSLTDAELIKACEGKEILISAGYNRLDRELLTALPSIKLICLYSVGFDHVDLEAAKDLNIQVTNTPDVLSKATADTAFLLMLATSRKAFYLSKTVNEGTWGDFNPMAHLGQELDGKTIGILGLGKIGFYMAKRCKNAFGMKIIYHNRSRNEYAEKSLAAEYVSFEDLLAKSDVLSLHVDLNQSTHHLMNASSFDQMKPNSILINTARGGVIQQDDLVAALKAHKIWGAGLDVTTPEPLPSNHELLSFPQVCILPHVGSGTVETREAMSALVFHNILAYTNGKHLITPLF